MKYLFYLLISTHYSSDVLGSKHFLSIFIAALAYLVKSAFTFNFGVVIFLTNGVISSKLHLSLVLNKIFYLSWILFGNLVSGKCWIWSLITSDKPSNWFRSTLKSSSFSLSILGRESCHMDKNSVKLKAVEDWSKYSP